MKKKLIATVALSAFLCTGITVPAEAAKSVPVTLPTFDVTLNGQVIENENRQYPLLVYNNITYVPMTYHDCRFLGLTTKWNPSDGLSIMKFDMTSAYHKDSYPVKNKKRDTAQIASGTIKVNDKTIDNKSEKYPLLMYRDITYFPLTWRFAVNEFGWKYQFDSKTGLNITANNIKTESIILDDARDEEFLEYSYAVNDGYLYYEGKQGEIYRRPLDDLKNDSKRVKIVQLEKNYETDAYPLVSLYAEGGKVYYRYHLGGPTMGSDYLYRISNDGTVSENLMKGKIDIYADYGDIQVQVERYVHGNIPEKILVIDKNGTREIGEENQVYSLCQNGYNKAANQMYVLAADWKEQFSTGEKYLYRLDLESETFTKIFDEPVEKAAYCDGELYIWQNLKRPVINGTQAVGPEDIYKYDLYWLNQKTGEKVLVDEVNSECVINSNGVYYQNTEEVKLMYWNKEKMNAERLSGELQVAKLFCKQDFIVARLEESPNNPYRLMILDSKGNPVYKSADDIDHVEITEAEMVIYRLDWENQLVKVQL